MKTLALSLMMLPVSALAAQQPRFLSCEDVASSFKLVVDLKKIEMGSGARGSRKVGSFEVEETSDEMHYYSRQPWFPGTYTNSLLKVSKTATGGVHEAMYLTLNGQQD